MKQYVKPKSVTFWAGSLLILLGLILGVHDVVPIGATGDILRGWAGEYGSAALILNGLSIIGIRRAIAANGVQA